MLAGARDPTPDGGFGEIEDPCRGVGTEAFGDGVQDLRDARPRGLKPVERGVPAR
jgi:hypothetical protein